MTFIELMISIVIIGIMAAAVVLPQLKTIEASKQRSAKTILQAIAAGEMVYKTLNSANNHIFCSPAPVWPPDATSPPDCDPAKGWLDIFVDDPNVSNVVPGVAFTVTITSAGQGFTAMAVRNGGGCNGRFLTLDELGVWGDSAPAWPSTGC